MRPAIEIVSMKDYDNPVYIKCLDRVYRPDLGDFSISIVFPNIRIEGDYYVRVYHQHDLLVTTKTAMQMMFRFAFHTSFLKDNLLSLSKEELDSPWHGAVENKNLPHNFQATLVFDDTPMEESDQPKYEKQEHTLYELDEGKPTERNLLSFESEL